MSMCIIPARSGSKRIKKKCSKNKWRTYNCDYY